MGQDIVIVDDDPDTREILDLILGTLEIPIRQAGNGFEALSLILEDPPLLVVLDMAMPHLDGRAVLQVLKADPTMADLPVIVFTASEITAEVAEELQVPLSLMARKGRLSMTQLREIVVQVLGDAVDIDVSLL